MPARRLLGALTAALPMAAGGCTVVANGPAPRATDSSGERGATPGAVASAALSDIERFWVAHYPALDDGRPFRPVRGGYHPYTRRRPPPACGSEPAEYQPNAFYCPDGDFIAWDAENLIPQLDEQFGPLLVGVVLAHEYGHAVQERLGLTGQPTVVLEQQADCFAGAWTADVLAGRSTAFHDVTAAQLDNSIAGLLMLRDQPGLAGSWTYDLLHRNPGQGIRLSPGDLDEAVAALLAFGRATEGTGATAFERIAAYRNGVLEGLPACG